MYTIDVKNNQIDAVKVLALRPLQFIDDLPRDEEIMTNGKFRYHILGEKLCDQQQAEKIVRLWNALPPGEPDHYHNPGFALQFIKQNEISLTAAICWGCNNISINGPLAATEWRVFNGRSEIAIQLLRLCGDILKYIYG